MRINTDAILAAVIFFAVVNAVFTVIAVEAFWTGTGVICHYIWAHTIICTGTGFAVVNINLALQTCQSIRTDTNKSVDLQSKKESDLIIWSSITVSLLHTKRVKGVSSTYVYHTFLTRVFISYVAKVGSSLYQQLSSLTKIWSFWERKPRQQTHLPICSYQCIYSCIHPASIHTLKKNHTVLHLPVQKF